MTTPIISVGADTEQSLNVCNDSITDSAENFKDLEKSLREMQREMLRQMDPSYLKTVSLSALYDTDFEPTEALIDGLLYRGAYLFISRKIIQILFVVFYISVNSLVENFVI